MAKVYLVSPYFSTSEVAPVAFLDLDKAMSYADNTPAGPSEGFWWVDSYELIDG